MPASRRMWYVSDVVVVLPLLPVMQTIRASVYRPASSISERIGMPRSTAARTMGAVSGMPGLLTISSALRMSASV